MISKENLQATEQLTNEQDPNSTNHFDKCSDLLEQYKGLKSGEKLFLNEDQEKLTKILKDNGIDVPHNSQIDVYNPSIIFIDDNCECIAGRVELSGKEAEHNSLIVFFKHQNNQWIPLSVPTFKLQDPNISWLGNQMVLSGVELRPGKRGENPRYRNAFYSGTDLTNLSEFAKGPWDMKGVRFVELTDGRIGIYTRPQGKKGGPGNIGFTTVTSLDELKILASRKPKQLEALIKNAPLLSTNFSLGEWGGVNQVIPISAEKNLIIGHVAYLCADDKRHYFSCSFEHNFQTGEIENMKILAQRSDFPAGPAKAEDLKDVLYTAGIIEKDGKWFLIVGLSDTEAGIIEIEFPSQALEQNN